MSEDSTEQFKTERLRIHYAFLAAIIGLLLSFILVIFLVHHREPEIRTPAAVVGIVGLFTSVSGTIVGLFFGFHIGSAGIEHERRSRRSSEELARVALAHLNPDTAKELLRNFL
jgi:hypothetical protein